MAKKKIEMPKLRKLSDRTLESIRKETSKYIFVDDKQGNSTCECCQGKFILPKTKHLQKNVKCPKCGNKMQIVHSWRRHNEFRINWTVLVNTLNEHTVVFRYVMTERKGIDIISIKECARRLFDFEKKTVDNWEMPRGSKEWKKSGYSFVREYQMGGYRTNLCCLQADMHNPKQFITELKKLPRFKYLNITPFFTDKGLVDSWYINSIVTNLYKNADRYELLQKAGFDELIMKDMKYIAYDHKEIYFNPSEKSLGKKVGLTDGNLKMLKEYQTIDNYEILRRYPELTRTEFETINTYGMGLREAVEYHAHHLNIKQLKYVGKQGITLHEYVCYFRTCEDLEYPKTDYYLYPKDFKEMDRIVSDEYVRRTDELKAKKLAKQSEKIKFISDKLKELPELKKLMGGSKGLLVYVPESANDLINEGKVLHNCLGTYVDRVADRKTFIFYIRQLENPTAPFIAMEIDYTGHLIQCRYDHNKAVQDEKIIDFAKKVQKIVRKHANEIKAA